MEFPIIRFYNINPQIDKKAIQSKRRKNLIPKLEAIFLLSSPKLGKEFVCQIKVEFP